MTNQSIISRLAPSPTGNLHLGNAWSFLLSWLAAKKLQGKIILRMDDIDPARSKTNFIAGIMTDLGWLGLNWDQDSAILYQSEQTEHYEVALEKLQAQNLVYPCFCTRKELRQLANAPHPGDEGFLYNGYCANLSQSERNERLKNGHSWSLRLKFPEHPIYFTDLIQGPQKFEYHDNSGDFPLKRSDNVWSYQLATVVDDARSKVNLVCRGRDLLPSTARQIALLHYLNLPVPQYAHFPLLLDQCGERLAKRHNSLSIAELRKKGLSATEIIGHLAWLSGLNPGQKSGLPQDFIFSFDFDKIPKADISLNDWPFGK